MPMLYYEEKRCPVAMPFRSGKYVQKNIKHIHPKEIYKMAGIKELWKEMDRDIRKRQETPYSIHDR
jgi:hypothetical protein